MTGDESVSAEGAAVPTAVAAEYDAALPGEQTELAPSASETEAHTAWALDDGPEWEPPFWSAARITAAAAAGPLPDLMPYNGQFINNLRASGWAVWNEALMAQRGHETCAMLRDGEPRSLISQKLVALEPQVTFARAMQFTNIVSASYPNCP